MKNKLFSTAITAIAMSVTLMAMSGRADDSKSEPGLQATISQTDSPGNTTGKASEWSTDYEAALKQARETHRQILLDFTGSDWCSWCMRLDREILATPEFRRFADEHLVLVKIDFPMHKTQSDAEKARNEELAAHFQVQGYPTLVLLNSDATLCGTLGYMRGGPEPFVDQLNSLIANQP
jgi:thioredoxin-related protein